MRKTIEIKALTTLLLILTTVFSCDVLATGNIPTEYSLYINNRKIDGRKYSFIGRSKSVNNLLSICINSLILSTHNIRFNAKSECVDLYNVEGATYEKKGNTIHIFIDENDASAFNTGETDYLPAPLWREGGSALLFNYDLSTYSSYSRHTDTGNVNSRYLNLQPGFNIQSWRWRSYITYSKQSHYPEEWEVAHAYLQRNLLALNSQVHLGETTVSTQIFDDLPLRGIQLFTDHEMSPDNQNGYVPAIKGNAGTSAQVTITQGGYIIYQRPVPPGPFYINDLIPLGQGDFYVTVKESDGREAHFIVPYTAMDILLRPGDINYSLAYGTYRPRQQVNRNQEPIAQATLVYGLPSGRTLYAGIQNSAYYRSRIIGAGLDMGVLGSVSIDGQYSQARFNQRVDKRGYAMSMRYKKTLPYTNGSLSLSFRHMGKGFCRIDELYDSQRNFQAVSDTYYLRQHFDASYTQDLWDINAGYIDISLTHDLYSVNAQKATSVLVSYNNSWKNLSFNLQYSYTNLVADYTLSDDSDYHQVNSQQSVNLTVSIPFNAFEHNLLASYAVNSSRHGQTGNTIRLSGSSLQHDTLSWDTSVTKSNHNGGYRGNFSANYQYGYGDTYASYGYDKDSYQTGFGIRGGALVHQSGLTLAKTLGDTVALVSTGGKENIPVLEQDDIMTDAQGYAVIPWLAPFRKNDISINCASQTDTTCPLHQTAVPTRGAVVLIDFSPSYARLAHPVRKR